MAVYHEAGSVLSASEMNQTVQATAASSTDQAHCLQSGTKNVTMTAGAPVSDSVTFGTAYTARPYIVCTIRAGNSSGDANNLRVHVYSADATEFYFRVTTMSGTPTITVAVDWMAFGEVSA